MPIRPASWSAELTGVPANGAAIKLATSRGVVSMLVWMDVLAAGAPQIAHLQQAPASTGPWQTLTEADQVWPDNTAPEQAPQITKATHSMPWVRVQLTNPGGDSPATIALIIEPATSIEAAR